MKGKKVKQGKRNPQVRLTFEEKALIIEIRASKMLYGSDSLLHPQPKYQNCYPVDLGDALAALEPKQKSEWEKLFGVKHKTEEYADRLWSRLLDACVEQPN